MIPYALAGSALILVASFLRGTDKYEDLCIATAIPTAVCLLCVLGAVTSYFRPVTIDANLRSLDLALGMDGFALRRWLDTTPLVSFFACVYFSLPLVMAICWVVDRSPHLLRSVVIGGLLAAPIYLVFPAAGPVYAFNGWPAPSATLASVILWFHPRNCVPSMHMVWALLLPIHARNWMWKFALSIYAAVMIVGTVAGGEHYFIDVIVAVPFTFAVQWIAERTSAKAVRLAVRRIAPASAR